MSTFNDTNPNQTIIQLQNLYPEKLLETYDKYMCLQIYIDNSDNSNSLICQKLKQKYIDAALSHNNKILKPNSLHFDAGFDLFVPQQIFCQKYNSMAPTKIDLNVICSAQMITDTNKVYNTGYYMYPRSSISKTKLRLANGTGIIDSGYRGHLIGMFDIIDADSYVIENHDRLLQICAPGLVPIVVQVVDRLEELGSETERGAGGFGSSGR